MTTEPCTTGGYVKCVSWTAILVGALVGLGLSFLLNLFGVAIGLSMTTTQQGVVSFAVGGFLGLLIGAVASMFIAGFVAGFLGRACVVNRHLGVLYGFTTWCVMLVLTALLTLPVNRFIGTYSGFISTPSSVHVENNSVVVANEVTNDTTTVSNNAQKDLALATFFVFVLFFIGAFSSCAGGYFGMVCDENCCPFSKHNEPTKTL